MGSNPVRYFLPLCIPTFWHHWPLWGLQNLYFLKCCICTEWVKTRYSLILLCLWWPSLWSVLWSVVIQLARFCHSTSFSSRMFEELIDVKKMINPESYNPNKVYRPSLEPQVEYEDTPEFRQSLNMKVSRDNFGSIKIVFCRTSLPLASSRCVRSTFLSHCPLSSKQCRWLTSARSTNFSSEKYLGMLGIKPGAAGSGSKCANHCAMLPQPE